MADKEIFGNYGPSDPNLRRSTYDLSHTNNMTANIGPIYPCLVELAPPDSTYSIIPHVAFDMFPMLSPIQSNVRCHVSFYKCALRNVWKNYQPFFKRLGQHVVPYISRTEDWHATKSLSDYMGLPSQEFQEVISRLSVYFPYRGYIYYDDPLSLVDKIVNLVSSHASGFLNPFSSERSTMFHDQRILTSNSGSNERVCMLSEPLSCVPVDYIDIPFLEPLGEDSSSSLSQSVFPMYLFSIGTHSEPIGGGDTRIVVDSVQELILPHQSGVLSRGSVSPGRWALISQNNGLTVTVGGVKYLQRTIVLRMPTGGSDIFSVGSRLGVSWSVQNANLLGDFVNMYSPSEASRSVSSLDNAVVTISPATETKPEEVVSSQLVVKQFPFYKGLQPQSTVDVVDYTSRLSVSPFRATVSQSGEIIPPPIPIDAFAWRVYEFVYNYYFRNQRVDPFMLPDPETGLLVPEYNRYITNDGDGADSTTPVDFKYAPYEYDLFTTAVKEPQLGPAPLVGITTNDSEALATLNMLDPDSGQYYNIGVELGENGKMTYINNYDEVADKTSVMRLLDAIKFGISINDFRNVSALQVIQERMLKAGYKYADLVQEFFGVRPPIGEEYPEFLGGLTRDVSVRPIINTAQSSGNALGESGGIAGVDGHGSEVNCYCKEWSIILGVVWFSVTPTYPQKLDKHFTYRNWLDFYNPQLASIGPQPIYKYQLCPLQLYDHTPGVADPWHRLHDVLGYGVPWSDMISRQDSVHGDFRGSLYHYLLQRSFVNPPDLGHELITMNPKHLNDVWATKDGPDKIYGGIRFEMTAKIPKPRIWIPHITA